MNTSFIIALRDIRITDDLAEGIEILPRLKLTNDIAHFEPINDQSFMESIGNLELSNLKNAGAIVYSNSLNCHPSSRTNIDPYLVETIQAVCDFLFASWIIKDNAVYTELGYFFRKTEVTKTAELASTHSNLLFLRNCNCFSNSEITEFSSTEILKIVDKMKSIGVYDYLNTRLASSPDDLKRFKTETTFAASSNKEIFDRFAKFIGAARTALYLDLKVSYLIMAFEAIFSLDNTELSHQVSERVAFLLENSEQQKCKLYDEMKAAYRIRSKVVHGSQIKEKDFEELKRVAQLLDNYARQVFCKFLNEQDHEEWTSDNMDKRKEYYKNLIFS